MTAPGATSPHSDYTQAVAFYDALSERLQAVPGVTRVALTSALPFSGLDARLDLRDRAPNGRILVAAAGASDPRVVSEQLLRDTRYRFSRPRLHRA